MENVLSNQLASTLKQSSDTKWNSVLHALSSVLEAKDKLWKLLSDGEPSKKFHDIDWSVVRTLIEFLQPFDDATKQLEGDRYPTLHIVYQCFCKLKHLMTLSSSDSELSKDSKMQGLQYLLQMFCIFRFRFMTYI